MRCTHSGDIVVLCIHKHATQGHAFYPAGVNMFQGIWFIRDRSPTIAGLGELEVLRSLSFGLIQVEAVHYFANGLSRMLASDLL